MTDYGLTPAGPVRPTAAEIRARIVTGIKAIPRFANARTTTGSALGELIDVLVNEISQNWEAWEASVHAFSRDSASDQSLDALLTLIGKSRVLASYTLVDLTLWSIAVGTVLVPEGNQASQSATGILFETIEDAEIPAGTVVLEDLEVGAIAHVSGSTIQYSLPTGTDLSAVTTGMLLHVVDSGKSANDGAFLITAVSDGSDYVRVSNPKRDDNTANEADSPGTATITNAHVTVMGRAVAKGETSATAQSIDTIATPVSDWAGVVNLTDATVGRDTETDAEVRIRVPQELSIAKGSTVEAIKEQLRAVVGVSYVAGDSEDEPLEADYGYYFTVVGGATQDIVDCIGLYKAGGVPTRGDTSGTYTNPEGQSKEIYFSRVTNVTVYLEVNLTTIPHDDNNPNSYPTDGDDQVEAALVALGESLAHGQDIYNYMFVGAIYAAGIPGITGIEVLADTSASPTLPDDIAISPTQIGSILAGNITVNS